MNTLNIALFSPNQNPYSETFVQAHKQYLNDQVYFYYGNKRTLKLEGSHSLISGVEQKQLKIKRRLGNKSVDYIHEKTILLSLKKNKIDVILIEYGTHAYHLMPILKLANIPFVVHFHGFDASVTSVIEKCDKYKEVFEFATKIIAVSKKMEQMLIKLGCPNEKIAYSPCGPNVEFEKVKPLFLKKQFLAIGRFTNKKAPYYTILAFKEVLKKHPETMLLMAGDGVLYNACENLISHFGLKNNVKLIGVISPNDFRKLLEESWAFVQHSITADNGDMEGTPVSVLEASAAGLPIISTNHAGIPDVVIHEKSGLLCDEHDVDAMAQNMLLVLDDKALAKRLGEQGKKHIQTYFNMNRHIQVLQEQLETAAKKRSN